MDSKLLQRIELITFWLLSSAFLLAAITNFVYGRLVFGWFGLFAAIGLFPPLKFPLLVKMVALAVAGMLIFIS